MVLRTASLTIASPLGGSLGSASASASRPLFGCAVMTSPSPWIAWAAYESNLLAFGIGLIGQGVGHGLSQPSITSAIAHSVDESDLGVASAANRLAGQGGASFGIAALTLVYGGVATPSAFGLAFGLGAVLAAVSTVTAVWIDFESRRARTVSRISAVESP